jgi:hypothetical protein
MTEHENIFGLPCRGKFCREPDCAHRAAADKLREALRTGRILVHHPRSGKTEAMRELMEEAALFGSAAMKVSWNEDAGGAMLERALLGTDKESEMETCPWCEQKCKGRANLGLHMFACPKGPPYRPPEVRRRLAEAPGSQEHVAYLPDGEVRARTAEELAEKLRARGYDATVADGTLLVSESKNQVGTVTFTPERGSGPRADHSESGPCEACDWSYCRVREVKAEPRTRCGGCDTGAPDEHFEGGAMFAFPVNAVGMPDSANRCLDDREDGQPLCPRCAEQVARFIKHLRDTNGGRR